MILYTIINANKMMKVVNNHILFEVPEGGQFTFSEHGIMKYILRMLSSAALFWCLLMIVEYRIVQRIFEFEPMRPIGDVVRVSKYWLFK